MIKRIERLALLGLGCLAVIWGVWIFSFRVSDVRHFKAMLDEHRLQKNTPFFTTTTQERVGVVKDLYIVEEQGRMHHKIVSRSSRLFLIPEKHHFDVVEKLDHLTCWMQEHFYPATKTTKPEQQVRLLLAQEGFYRYSTQEFVAQSVDLSLYRLPGQFLPEQIPSKAPQLRGHAQDISFTLTGKTPQFKANQFKAELSQGKSG